MVHYAARSALRRVMIDSHPVPPGPSRLRRVGVLLAKVLVSVGLLGLLLSRVDSVRLWETARGASFGWMGGALALYFAMCALSAWRWRVLLAAQRVVLSFGRLLTSFLVATFFNNFLPSNIGGDVVRIGDTARAAGSKTLATTVVVLDRGIGLIGLLFVAAVGATLSADRSSAAVVGGVAVLWTAFGMAVAVSAPLILAPPLVSRLLRPLERLHQEWVRERLDRLTTALGRFRDVPMSLVICFAGGVLVQLTLVAFYAAVARGLHIPISMAQLAVLVPLSFIVQMVPVSLNGFGVREATFTLYFARLGLPAESAFALSFLGAVLIMIFSLTGAAAYVMRGRQGAAVDESAGEADTAG